MTGSRTSFPSDWDPSSTPPLSDREETLDEVARRVLFSNSLDEKLRGFELSSPPCEEIKSANLSLSVEPGRPEILRFASEGTPRPNLPATPALIEEESRGVLLHFFANHELLAAELMALALLRFPDAPVAFRKGLAHTLREEQRHTHWYIQRMKQCGVEFGQYPVNRFFWDAVSSMDEPIDYVSRLSLTFEQANLDYANHFSQLLSEAGDRASSALLRRIYEDEISHVGYGLSWFRKWKREEESDWEALEKRLTFPLSPSRAKGNRTEFNIQGRRAAGLDEEYIQKLALFERSNGRTPNLFFFNPDAENQIAALPRTYHPRKRVRALIDDLEFLCCFLSRRDDVALLRRAPSESHLTKLRQAGFVLPEIEVLTDERLDPESLLQERKIDTFLPWSKAPGLAEAFPSFGESTNPQPLLHWQESDRLLFSKQEQSRVFSEWFGTSIPIQSATDLEKALETYRSLGCSELIWKRSIGNAGGGMQRLSLEEWEDLLNRSQTPQFSQEGGFLLEPHHARVFDFSVQFEIRKGELRFLGTVEQIIQPSGGYRGSIAMPKLTQGQPPSLARFLATTALPVYSQDSPLCHTLLGWAKEHHYEGPLGIDSYVFEDSEGDFQHRPICEINTRHTMGRVALELKRQIAPGFGVRLDLFKAEHAPPETPPEELPKENQRIADGTIALTERRAGTELLAMASVAKKRAELISQLPETDRRVS
ncbi:MAG: DUF455 family protein [Verrucomicrobiales bacterium]|nr:DUF455 family protein [Verrucomicrobiales bacterium]